MSAFVHDWNEDSDSGRRPDFVDETWSAVRHTPGLARPSRAVERAHTSRLGGFGVVLAAGAEEGGEPAGWRLATPESLSASPPAEGVQVDLRLSDKDLERGLSVAESWLQTTGSLGVLVTRPDGVSFDALSRLELTRVVLDGPEGLPLPEVRSMIRGARARLPAAVRLGFRGRNDHGLGVARALVALEAGADLIYGTFLGVGARGERVPLDQVLVNAYLSGLLGADRDLKGLVEVLEDLARVLEWPIPPNYPLVGRDAFRTATGVHAAAIVKALARQDPDLADRVYSGVPAGAFGKSQTIELGPMSGMSNVRYWLERAGQADNEALAEQLYARAKGSDRILTSAEIAEVIAQARRAPSDPAGDVNSPDDSDLSGKLS